MTIWEHQGLVIDIIMLEDGDVDVQGSSEAIDTFLRSVNWGIELGYKYKHYSDKHVVLQGSRDNHIVTRKPIDP